jgi:hypothetical protein
MKFAPNRSTLSLHLPLGRTLIITIPLVVILLMLVEMLVRVPMVQSILPEQTRGGAHDELDVKLNEFDRINGNQETPCLIIGNSMVSEGIATQVLGESYQHQTGHPLTCYNFGLYAYTAATWEEWAAILVHRYHPKLLIFGTSARDYSEELDKAMVPFAVDTAWARYQRGEFTLEGWLAENSIAYRYYLRFRGWAAPDFLTRVFGVIPPPDQPAPKPVIDVTRAPQESDRLFNNYHISQADLHGLHQILNLQNEGIEVLVVELPFSSNYLRYFERGEKDYQLFVDTVSDQVEEAGIPWLSRPADNLIPTEGWADYHHLNETGASIYSDWLGQQIARLIQQGLLADPTAIGN